MANDVLPKVNLIDHSQDSNHTGQLQAADPPLSALTARQRDVLLLICEGLTAKETSYKLGISPKTIEFHHAAICDRLCIHSTAGLVRYAIRQGLIVP